MVKTEDYTRELVRIFFAQKYLIFFTTALFVLCAVVIVLFGPSMYAADGSILVKGKRRVKSPDALESNQTRGSLLAVTKQDLASEVETIMSFDVLENTVKNLALMLESEGDAQVLIGRVQKNLRIELVPSTSIIKVRYLDGDPQVAVQVLRQIFTEYLNYRFEIYNPSGIEAFYKKQALAFMDEITQLEGQLIDLSQRTGSPRPSLEIENNLRSKKMLEQQLDQLRSLQVEKKLQVENLQRDLDATDIRLFSYIQIQSINDLSEKVQRLVVEKARLMSAYLPESQKITGVDRQIAKATNALKTEVEAYTRDLANGLKIIESQIAMVEQRLAEIKGNNKVLHRQQIETDRINRQLEQKNQAYAVLNMRWQEARINRSADTNNLFDIKILSKPVATTSAVYPQARLLVPFGFLAGVVTGCCVGFIRAYFDHTIKNPDDVRNYTGLPIVISIPDWDTNPR